MIRGLVLAGGRSRRFGSDKALATYHGRSFLDIAISVLKELNLSPVISGTNEARPDFSCPVLPDLVQDKGPLGGIYTAMSAFPKTSFLVLTCDMPALDVDVLRKLIDAYVQQPALTLYRLEEKNPEPFPGIYPHALFSRITEHLSSHRLSLQDLIRNTSEANILPYQGPSQTLSNINHVFELKSL